MAGRLAARFAQRQCRLGLSSFALRAKVFGAIATAIAGTVVIHTAMAGAQTSTTTTSPPAPTAEISAATTLVLRAISAETQMGSVHLDGSITQGKSRISMHLVLDGTGDGTGQFTQAGSPIKLTRTGQLLYLNAPKKFWASHTSKAETEAYGGKWLEFSALDTNLSSFDKFLDASDLVAATFMGHRTPLTLSQPTTVDHRKVVIVKDVSTTNGRTTTSTMDIASSGQPYVYRIVDRAPGEVGILVFSKYGKAVKITAPAHALNLTSSTTTTTAP